jgi:hypothetical protein
MNGNKSSEFHEGNSVADYATPVLWLCGPGSSVSIVTGYGLDGPGIESW